MTWELVFQSFTVALAGIASWFLYDLISEFKEFKKEARRDILDLMKERASFQSTVKQAELGFGIRVNDLQKLHQEFAAQTKIATLNLETDIKQVNFLIDSTMLKASQLDTYFQKMLIVVKRHDELLKTMKIQLDNLIIFKGE